MSYMERHDMRVDAEDASLIVYQVLKGVAYLHGQGITHRDLKPENILMSTTTATPRVVITDFGGATKGAADKRRTPRMDSLVGTYPYQAPEVRGKNSLVHQRGYTNAVDMWSVGCVTARLLTGQSAFAISQGSTDGLSSEAIVLAAAAKCDLSVLDDPLVWGDIDEQAKDFIRGLVFLNDRARFTAQQALAHEWFTQRQGSPITDSYDQAIAQWKPSFPGWDFKEHLDCFIDGRISESDVSLINPGKHAVLTW